MISLGCFIKIFEKKCKMTGNPGKTYLKDNVVLLKLHKSCVSQQYNSVGAFKLDKINNICFK
jgi:hypothetical protein